MSVSIRLTLFLLLMVLSIPVVLAKAATVKIVVSGDDLAEPIAITDADVVSQFSIWSGPNSRWRARNGSWNTDYSRIFIDFPGGPIDPPLGDLAKFKVEFHVAVTRIENSPEEIYTVLYAFDPIEAIGYMYLPTGNPFIHHGVEDNWFRSTDAWENLVRPMIQDRL